MRNQDFFRVLCMTGVGATALMAAPAHAQTSDAAAGPSQDEPNQQTQLAANTSGEIVVTARRREETSLSAPVTLTAVSGEELTQKGITDVDGLSRVVPNLITSEATSSPQGGIVAIRGLSGVDANPFGDQAVSFNIDGVPVARSSVRRLGQFDVGQIEVLKGPQALFFGKNSPAGIIVVRTADPTPFFEGEISAGYEFNADEVRTEGYLSGPITDTLGFRVAGFYSNIEGYVDNVAPDSGANVFVPFDRRAPNGDSYAVRGTLTWDPSDLFDARLKVSYNESDGSGSTDLLQQVNCGVVAMGVGMPQNSLPPEDCVLDDKVTTTDNIGPNFGIADPRFGNGETFLKSDQTLASLEMNYDLTDTVQLSSITGFYEANNSYVGNFTATFVEAGFPRTILPAFSRLNVREITQELRLTTDFGGPVNFMIGGLFQDTHGEQEAVVYFNANTPVFASNYAYTQEGTAYSIFLQSLIDLSDEVELSVGGRYSYEKKDLTRFQSATAASPRTLIDVNSPNQATFNNLSPEATLTYRPTRNLTLYGSYKEGFLSGGFNATQPALSPTPGPNGNLVSLIDPRYGQQITRGFEGGIKASLLDGDLRTNFSVYSYETTGLQVAVLVGLQQELRNAGEVQTDGAEFDFTYRTPLDGLSINGAVAYLDGKYTDYQSQCYRGLPAPQCRQQINRFTGQPGLLNDLSGTELVRAPEWVGNIGFNYESPEFSGMKLGLSGGASFTSSFFTDVVSAPGGRQEAYELFDASVRLIDANERWELAVIGRNLGDEYYFTRSADNPFSGSAPGGTGTTLGDTVAVPARGREIWLRATFRFGG